MIYYEYLNKDKENIEYFENLEETEYNNLDENNSYIVKNNNLEQDYKNQISNSLEINNIINNNENVFGFENSDEDKLEKINNILKKGPLKLGCCLKNNNSNNMKTSGTNVSYMVPLTEEVAKQNEQLKSFDYQRGNIEIPADSCPLGYETYSNNCNAFMDVYCLNMIEEFKKLNLPMEKFKDYSLECACYAPNSEIENLYPQGTPSKCYKDGCSENSISYLNKNSQNISCNLATCTNIVNATNLAGEKVELTSTLENQCGYFFDVNSESNSNDINEVNIENIEGELNYEMNYRAIRYSDVLLMAAEANNRKTSADDVKAQN